MKKIIKIVAIVLGLSLIIIQFIHPEKNTSPEVSSNDVTKVLEVPDSVQTILSKACYDCHSNNTRYPWYNNIQPVAWWLNDHITEGKRHLNFSEFGSYKLLKQAKVLAKCAKEVDKGGMPLNSYTWIHKDAVLSDNERQVFMSWCNSRSKELYAKVSPEEIAADKKQQEERRKNKHH